MFFPILCLYFIYFFFRLYVVSKVLSPFMDNMERISTRQDHLAAKFRAPNLWPTIRHKLG